MNPLKNPLYIQYKQLNKQIMKANQTSDFSREKLKQLVSERNDIIDRLGSQWWRQTNEIRIMEQVKEAVQNLSTNDDDKWSAKHLCIQGVSQSEELQLTWEISSEIQVV